MKTIDRIALVVTLLLGTSGLANADEAEILKAHFKAVGGLDRLSEIKTVKRSGAAKMGGVFGEMAGTIQEAVVVGKKSYYEMDLGMHRESTGWNGTTGWKTTPLEGTVTLSGYDLEVAKAAAFLDPLQDLYEQFGSAAYNQEEDDTIRGRDCVTLRIVDTDVVFYVDKETSYVVAMKTSVFDPALGDVVVATYYSDYSEYDGVVLPNSTDIDIADGTITVKLDYSKTEIDVEVDGAIFEKS